MNKPSRFVFEANLCALVSAVLLVSTTASALDVGLRRCDAKRFPFVFLNLVVSADETGQPIEPPLDPGSFECFENGEKQNTDVFPPEEGRGARGADIVFVIDSSGSMAEEIAEVRDNIATFVAELEQEGFLAEGTFLGLVRFGATNQPEPFTDLGLTDDVGVFLDALSQFGATGSYEPGFWALNKALDELSFTPGAPKVFILITDEDSDAEGGGDHASEEEKQETIARLQDEGAIVFTAVDCNFGFARSDYCDESSIAAATGGLQFNVTDPLSDIIDDIADRIGDTYVLRYSSRNPQLDATERHVECNVSHGDETASVSCDYTPASAPKIELTRETNGLRARSLAQDATPKIAAIVTDDVEPLVEEVMVFYRVTGAASYTALEMLPVGSDIYEATIPTVSPPGLDFYIKATDGEETSTLKSINATTDPFQVAVRPNEAPSITHSTRSVGGQARSANGAKATAGVRIQARVRDDTDFVEGVFLRWRNFGDLFYDTIEMEKEGRAGLYVATIPGELIQAPLEYYIEAIDNHGVGSTYGTPDDPCPSCTVPLAGAVAIRGRGPSIPRR